MGDNPLGAPKMSEIDVDDNTVRPSPAEIYYKTIRKRKRIIKIFIVIFLAVETFIAYSLGMVIKENRILPRMLREFENKYTGQISTPGGIYRGETDFGAFVGTGTFETITGSTYQGEWDNNCLEGLGSINIPSTGTYTGNLSDAKKSGQGTFIWDDGSIYEGKWLNDAMEGQGHYTSSNGISYVGTFKNNLFMDGTCTYKDDNGNYSFEYINNNIESVKIEYENGIVYSGDYGETAINGTGVMQYTNGDNYSGNYVNNKRNGQGVYTWNSGDEYDGEWEDDIIEGLGTYTFSSGNYYSGLFRDGAVVSGNYFIENEFGSYLFYVSDGVPESVEMTLADGTTYSGQLTPDGNLTGSAQIQYSNGDKYSGKIKDGAKTGLGQYTWSNKASYDGSWENDTMSGKGTYFYPPTEDGYKLTGTFVNGVPSGECYYYTTANTKYKTDWSEGVCVKIYE